MVHELAIITGLVLMLVCLTTSDYAGLSFKLTRSADDKFKNPTAKTCNWQEENKKFCTDANSRCDGNCCQCICDYATSTFVRSTMKCQNNNVIRNGCKAKFNGNYDGSQIKFLALNKKSETKIYWPVDFWSDKVKSFNILSIASYHDGSEIKTMFLKEKGKPKKRGDGKWENTIKWDKTSQDYYGQVFRVNISYGIERELRGGKHVINKNDCFVFKSSGSITVTFPSHPSTTLPSSTTEISTIPSTTLVKYPSSTTPSTTDEIITTTQPIDPVEPSVSTNEVSTPSVSKTAQESKETRKPTESTDKTVPPLSGKGPTLARKEEQSGEGNTAVTVPLVVVGCIVLVVVVVLLVVLWTRRRSASKDKARGTVNTNDGVDNPTIMSQSENIYAEADNSINYRENGKDKYVYDYAKGNLENNYTSLDMSKVENKPTYESLVNVQTNLYEQIPVNGNTMSAGAASCQSGQTPIAEPVYHVVDTPEENQDPGQIYHLPNEAEETGNHKTRKIPGRTGHDDDPERVYSILEEESVPENYGREVPGRTGDNDPEMVYSVLEDETAESDYLTILPEKSDYEQPVNPPVADS